MLGYVLGVTLVLTALSFGFFAESFAIDDSFNIKFDKKQYHPGDSLTISGEILDLGMPVIAASIYDPSGKILSANTLEISSENTFSKSISLVSPFYEKTGEYTVKLDYGQISENHYFTVVGEKPESKVSEESVEDEPGILWLSTEKKQYTDKDVIKINGVVSSLSSPTVLIGLYDPFGMPAGFYFGLVNSDSEFSTSFLIKSGVNFKVDGTYSIKAHYAEKETVSFFDYHKEIVQPVIETPSRNIPQEKTDDDVNSSSDKNNSDKTSGDEEVDSDSSAKSSDEKLIPKDKISNDDSADSSPVTEEKKQKSTLESESDSIIQNKVETIKDEKTINSETKQKQILDEKNNSEKILKTEPKKHSNLSVEDIELGKLLNQINLECDPSTLTDTISYYDGMGPALYRLCNFDDSLNFFNDSLVENPNDVEILVNKGSTLGKLGFFSEALVYYDQAIDINPDFLPAKNNKANALANLGSIRDAILLYDEILDKNPDYATARKNLEIVLSQTMPDETLVAMDSSSSSSLKTIKAEPHISEEENLIGYVEKINITNNTKQKPVNFFEEVGFAFSSLFGFLN